MMLFSSPDNITDCLKNLPLADQDSMDKAHARQQGLTKPAGSLGVLEHIAIWMAGWQGKEKPLIKKAQCVIFAGNHGITKHGVSAFPSEVTAAMVANFESGGAAINQICRLNGITLNVHALDLDTPTADFTQAPAMSIAETLAAMRLGAESVNEDTDIFIAGEMGIGNTTPAAALAMAIMGGEAAGWTGRGTGLDDSGMTRKRKVVEAGIALHKDTITDTVSALAALGGRELAAIAGAVLAARIKRIPVLLDGFIVTASCLPLWMANPGALDHCMISHCSREAGHRHLIDALGKRAILDLDLRLGEASGAAIALSVVKAALATHNGMATFSEAGVATSD